MAFLKSTKEQPSTYKYCLTLFEFYIDNDF